jgi:L-threonylcarbamoyladenylate synthase
MIIIGVESSCDDSCIGLVIDGKLVDEYKISTWNTHQALPDIDKLFAAKMHKINLPIACDIILRRNNLLTTDVTHVGFTAGPGMSACLRVGSTFVEDAFPTALKLSVDHLLAHCLVVKSDPDFTLDHYYCLLVSGVHTQLYLVHGLERELLASIPGNLGHCIDMCARNLNIDSTGYGSGGAALEQAATNQTGEVSPIPITYWEELLDMPSALLVQASFVFKLITFLNDHVPKDATVVLCGGVASNRTLRQTVTDAGYRMVAPKIEHCTDNGAMIAWATHEILRIHPAIGHMSISGTMLYHSGSYRQMYERPEKHKYSLSITEAARSLNTNQNVAFPTETVYGLGGRADSDVAIRGIYTSKGRPNLNPVIVHISCLDHLDLIVPRWREMPSYVHMLINEWPAPMTLVFPYNAMEAKYKVSPLCNIGHPDTVAIRYPNHIVALSLISLVGPIAAPSANTSGRPSPTTFEHVANDIGPRIAGIVPTQDLPVYGIESTIVDVTGPVPVILRPGPFLPCNVPLGEHLSQDTVPKAPGMKFAHYKPDIEFKLVEGRDCLFQWKQCGRRIGFIQWQNIPLLDAEALACSRILLISNNSDELLLERYLYLALWALNTPDSLDMICVDIRGIQRQGLLDRLTRAAST